MILVSGSAGLIGRRIVSALRAAGAAVREFDVRTNRSQDTRNEESLRKALSGVRGVIHLAAISRVVWAENDPVMADEVNVRALRKLVGLASESRVRPWIVFASSREVYGEQEVLPVGEDALLKPMNHYAHSKVAGEEIMRLARQAGMQTAICRFSNVFGCREDHHDRVAVAFARAAALGGELRLEGGDNRFDFTHVDDVSRGLHMMTNAVAAGERLPPIHFVSGRSTSLLELADIAQAHARCPVHLRHAAPRAFDVSSFCGDPARARELLGWETRISVEQGFADLVDQFRGHVLQPNADPWFRSLPDPSNLSLASAQ